MTKENKIRKKKTSAEKKQEPKKNKVDKPKGNQKMKNIPSEKNKKTQKYNKKSITENDKKEVSKLMGKRFLVIIPVIIIICIIGFLWFSQGSDVVRAQLVIESGNVQVKQAGGSWSSGQNGMFLHQSDSVKTGDNTSASVVLFESSIIRLDSNTEVTIQEIIEEAGVTSVKIQQDAGRTWNTISKISGIDNYDIQTPTTVASVRGTAFVVIVESNGTTYYGVSHGILNVSSISNGTIQDNIDVSGNESVIIYVDMVNKSLEIKPFEKDEWVMENLLIDEQFRIDVKEELYRRIDPYIPELKERYGITDEELEVLIDGYLDGYFDLPPETPDWIREIIELS